MAYCRHCGAQMEDVSYICPNCGSRQEPSRPAVDDSGSFGWTVLGCCVPIAGLILWLGIQPDEMKKAPCGVLFV